MGASLGVKPSERKPRKGRKGLRPFVWTLRDEWKHEVLRGLTDLIDDAVIKSFRNDPPQYVVSDNMDWLHRHIPESKRGGDDIRDILAYRLPRLFSSVRAHHACSPIDLHAFRAQGVVPLDCDKAQAAAREFFLSIFSELTLDRINMAITEIGSDLRGGRSFWALDIRDFPQNCGHYLLYGSEYMVCIAAALSREGKDYRPALRLRGTPAFISADLPLQMMGDEVLCELSGVIFKEIFKDFCDGAGDSSPIDFTITTRELVAPDLLREWVFPEKIKDPFTNEIFIYDRAAKRWHSTWRYWDDC